MSFLFVLATIVGCGPPALTDTENRVVDWINALPPLVVNSFVPLEEAARWKTFDGKAWEQIGMQIPDAEKIVVGLIRRKDHRVALGKAWWALDSVATSESCPFLIAEASTDQPPGAIIEAVVILGRVGKGNPRVLDVLRKRLYDKDVTCSVAAAEALADAFPHETWDEIEGIYRCHKSTSDRLEKALARAKANAHVPEASTDRQKP